MISSLNESQRSLAEEYIPLARSRANFYHTKYNNKGLLLDIDDFLSYAFEGLCKATLKFDENKNFKFSTYAFSYIDNYIKTNVYVENPTIRLPLICNPGEHCNKLRNMAISNSMILYIDEKKQYDCEGNSFSIGEKLNYKDTSFDIINDNIQFEYFFESLNKVDKDICKLLFLDGFNQSEIAEKLDLHINTISRRKIKLLNLFKDKMLRGETF